MSCPTIYTLSNISGQSGSFHNLSGSYLELDYYNLPAQDPLIRGHVWRDQNDFLKISAGWTPSQINTIAWYDGADTARISSVSNIINTVEDKSSNGVTLTVPSGNTGPKTGTRTLSNLNVIEWDTSGQLLENSSFSHNQASSALYLGIIFKVDVDGLQDFLFAGRDSVSPGNRMAIRRNVANSNIEILGGSGTGVNIRISSPTNSCTEGNEYIILVKLNSTTSEIRINGVSQAVGNIGTNTLNTFTIGGNALGVQNIDGYIAEFVAFLDPEEEKIEGYLAHKWGLSYLLPASHTYKTSPPF